MRHSHIVLCLAPPHLLKIITIYIEKTILLGEGKVCVPVALGQFKMAESIGRMGKVTSLPVSYRAAEKVT